MKELQIDVGAEADGDQGGEGAEQYQRARAYAGGGASTRAAAGFQHGGCLSLLASGRARRCARWRGLGPTWRLRPGCGCRLGLERLEGEFVSRRRGCGGRGHRSRSRSRGRCGLGACVDPVLGGLFQGLHQQAHRAAPVFRGVWGGPSGCGRKRWKNLNSSLSSVGLATTVGRRKITSSLLLARSFRNRNNSPKSCSLSAPGNCSRFRCTSSCMRPPRITVWPLPTCNTDSISRTWTCGTGFGRQFERLALHRLGLGSSTKGVWGSRRVTVGRTVRRTRPSSLTCGVTPMTTPNATVLGMVLNVGAVTTPPAVATPACAVTSK